MKLKVGTKIIAGFSIILLLLCIIGLSSIVSSRSIGENIRNMDEINNKLVLENSIESSFYRAVAGIRGYIAYGKDSYKDTYKNEISKVLEMENKLLEIADLDKKQEVQKLIEITTDYNNGISNSLIPAIMLQYNSTDLKDVQEAQKEVIRIASTLVPITGQLTQIIRGLVDNNTNKFKDSFNYTENNVSRMVSTSIILSIISLLAGLGLSLVIARSITKPVLEMISGANKYARGDFTEDIMVKSSDEVGDLAKSLNEMASQLRNLILNVVENSQTLAAHSEELAASAEEVSAVVEEVASTTNEVAAMAEKSMDNASATAVESIKAIEVAESGGKVVRKTIEKITAISESTNKVNESIQNLGELSAKIGNITDVITGIADQTNLLALNAAIEAARAGEQGRGFAVVAEEVRKLAEQSASAAREIGQLITKIQSGVDAAIKSMDQGAKDVLDGVNLASEAGTAIGNIIVAINKNIELIEEITEGSKQTSEGTQQLSASNEQVTSTIQQVAGSTQELADIASRLQTSVSHFKM